MSYPDQLPNRQWAFSPEEQWKKPFGLALAIHVAAFVFLLLPPSWFSTRPNLEDVQTIDLFTAEELNKLQKTAPPAPQPKVARPNRRVKPPQPEPKPEPITKEVTSIASEPPPVATPGEVVSLKPRKIKKKLPPPNEKITKVNDDKRLKALDRIRAQLNQKKEEQKIKHDLSKLRDMIHASTPAEEVAETEPELPPEPAQPAEETGGSSGSKALADLALKRYLISVQRNISDNWSLPKTQNWKKDLVAVAIIHIRKDGVIVKSYFEKNSKDIYFDQYVEKTIQAASPMPPIPSDIKQEELELGLKFRPSGMFY